MSGSPSTHRKDPSPSRPARGWVWLVAIPVFLLVGVAWSAHQLVAARGEAAVAAEQRDEAAALAGRLNAASAGDAAGQETSPTERAPLNQVVGEAAASRGVSVSDSGLRVDPGRPSRIGRTDFERVPLRVSLRAVTLEQAIGLLADVAASVPDMNTDEIRLGAPRSSGPGEPGTERWNLEAELSQLQHRPARDGDARP